MENSSTSALPPTTSTATAFGKKWRDKLRNTREKKQNAKLSVDEVVNDFLGTHRKNEHSNGNGADFVGSPPTDPPSYIAPKKPRRPGLKVSFDLGPPKVIGEGGEEANLPTKHIRSSRPSQQQPLDDYASPGDEEMPSVALSNPGNDELGFSDWRPPLTTDTTLLRALSSAGTGGKRRSRLSMRMDDETAELARKIRAKMIEEEGRALHQKPPDEDEEPWEARRSMELANAQRETNIVSPQPQRIVAYRPPNDGSPLNSFTERNEFQNDQKQESSRVQDMLSHLWHKEDTQLGELEPTKKDLLGSGSPPSSSNFPRSPPQQYQSYQRRSPSPERETDHTIVQQSSSRWKSTLSRANTTARPRLQPPASEGMLGRSLSMRAATKGQPQSNQTSSSLGWQKFQYQPASSPSQKQSNSKPLCNASSLSSPDERLGMPLERSPLTSSQLAAADENESPIQAQTSMSLLQDTFQERKSPTEQFSQGQSLFSSLDSPVSSSTTTLPAYEQAASTIMLLQPQLEESAQKDAPTANKSWRTLTSAVTRDALADFSAGAERYYSLFSLNAQDSHSTAAIYREKALVEWIRASVWWVLKGRNQLEVAIRQGGGITDLHQQGALSLAKAWWINAEVVPKHAELIKLKQQVATSNGNSSDIAKDVKIDVILNIARSLGDARLNSLITLHQAVSSHVRALAISMKRNNINLPPPDQLIKNVDLAIWVKYPYFGADVTALLSTLVPKNLRVDPRSKTSDIDIGELLPFSETTRFFTYGRMFVDAVLHSTDDDDDDDYRREDEIMPCMVSLAREKQDWHVQAFIASQSGLVNVVIQADKRQGLTWHDVRFDTRQCTASVRLSRNWKLELRFTGSDGKTEFERLWKMVEYSRTVEAGLNCEENEEIVFEGVLKAFQYVGAPGAAGTPFPAEPTPRCRVRLFEKQVPMTENGGTRFAHMGFRLICVTSPKVKNLSSISHTFTHSAPIIFAHARSKDDGENNPILLLKLTNRQTGAPYQIRLTFHDSAEMLKLHSLLLDVHLTESEEQSPDITLRSYSIDEPMTSGRSNSAFLPSLLVFPGQVTGSAAKSGVNVSVINTAKEYLDHGQSPAVMSNSLRLFTKCGWGSVTDRMNLGPGELKIALDPKSLTTFSIHRRGQHDLLISLADNLAPAEARETVTKFLKAAGSTPTIRRFQFNNLRDLHKFQTALTGFEVLFDGLATSFAISRRRMVVPIYKKWEASGARLQILQQEKSIQLVAFFADFSHGKGMNFLVKGTDVFEIFSKGGKYGVRIVDAKFPLPKKAGQAMNDEERMDAGEEEFLSLDLPDFPSEHDDITILFDDEHAWKGFQTAVPGIIREQSRIGSLRH